MRRLWYERKELFFYIYLVPFFLPFFFLSHFFPGVCMCVSLIISGEVITRTCWYLSKDCVKRPAHFRHIPTAVSTQTHCSLASHGPQIGHWSIANAPGIIVGLERSNLCTTTKLNANLHKGPQVLRKCNRRFYLMSGPLAQHISQGGAIGLWIFRWTSMCHCVPVYLAVLTQGLKNYWPGGFSPLKSIA